MPITVSRRRVVAAGALAAVAAPFVARAQSWPKGPIKIVVGAPAGGLTDLFARAYGEHLAQRLGTALVVENRAGAGGAVAALAVKNAPADGQTLLLTVSGTMFGNRVLIRNIQYDPDRDFSMISILPSGQLPLVAHRSVGAANVRELLEVAGRRDLSFGTYGAGSYAHINAYELNRLLDRKMAIVTYRGEAPMWQDLSGGAIQVACGSLPGAAPVLEGGHGRAVAVPGAVRMRRLPETATYLEQGVSSPAFQLKTWIGLFSQAAVAEEIKDRIAALMVEAGATAPIQKMLGTFGIDEAAIGRVASRQLYDAEGPVWVELVRKLEITPE